MQRGYQSSTTYEKPYNRVAVLQSNSPHPAANQYSSNSPYSRIQYNHSNASPASEYNYYGHASPTPFLRRAANSPPHMSDHAEAVYRPANKSWIGRLSMGMVQFARSSIQFLGGESEDVDTCLRSTPNTAARKSRGSRAVFWNQTSYRQSPLIMNSSKCLQLQFWKEFVHLLLTSTRKKLIASFIFVALMVAVLFCLGSSFASVYSAHRMKFEKFRLGEVLRNPLESRKSRSLEMQLPHINDSLTNADISKVLNYVKNYLEVHDAKLQATRHQRNTEIEALKNKLNLMEQKDIEIRVKTVKQNELVTELHGKIKELSDSLEMMKRQGGMMLDDVNSRAIINGYVKEETSRLAEVMQKQLASESLQMILSMEEKLLKSSTDSKFGGVHAGGLDHSLYEELKEILFKEVNNLENRMTVWITEEKSASQKKFDETLESLEGKMQGELLEKLAGARYDKEHATSFAQSRVEADIAELKRQMDILKHANTYKPSSDIHLMQNIPNNDKFAIIQGQLSELYSYFLMDTTAQVDWALQSLGAKIVYSKTTPSLNTDDWVEFILNKFASSLPSDAIYGLVKPMGKPAEIVLQPNVHPGECFSFSGNKGNITIHLPATVRVTSVSLEHVHMDINNNRGSAPKHFSVYGVADPRWPDAFIIDSNSSHLDESCNAGSEGCSASTTTLPKSYPWTNIAKTFQSMFSNEALINPLGDFHFDAERRIQTYPVQASVPLNRITFAFTENYGGAYTCIYRVRVHGDKMQRKRSSV